MSSRIEGTQATADEVLQQEAGLIKDGEKGADILEIINYRSTLFKGEQYLKDYPIKLSFIRELHKILLNSVRGQNKSPGEFRKDQNWIVSYGSPIGQASFIPPSPLNLQGYLEDWEIYLDSDDIEPHIQATVVHAQFELLHPFKDGNGRIGRILIPLFLYQKSVLSRPMFYLSEYFEANREEYYSRLRAISAEGAWNEWIIFFLKAMTEQAMNNSKKVKAILGLYDEMKVKVQETLHSQYSVHLLDAMFIKPIFASTDLVERLRIEFNIHDKTTQNLLRQLKDTGILEQLRKGKGRSPSILCFPELVNIAEGRNIL